MNPGKGGHSALHGSQVAPGRPPQALTAASDHAKRTTMSTEQRSHP